MLKLGNSKKAEEFYLKSISSFIKESGDKYYRLAEVYFDYGYFCDLKEEMTRHLMLIKKLYQSV